MFRPLSFLTGEDKYDIILRCLVRLKKPCGGLARRKERRELFVVWLVCGATVIS